MGFGIACIGGVLCAIATTRTARLGRSTQSLVDLIRPIPPIAWVPLAILWLGLGNGTAVFIVSLGAFFPVFVTTVDAIRSVPVMQIHIARCFGANEFMIVRDVVIPSSLPHVLSGFRVALGVAWTCVIAAELVGAQTGLGYSIQISRIMLQSDKLIATMMTIGAMGLAMQYMFDFIEPKMIPWKGNETG